MNKNKKGNIMKKKEEKINFDMSILSLSELIKVYENITDFLEYLESKKILPENNGEDQNE